MAGNPHQFPGQPVAQHWVETKEGGQATILSLACPLVKQTLTMALVMDPHQRLALRTPTERTVFRGELTKKGVDAILREARSKRWLE